MKLWKARRFYAVKISNGLLLDVYWVGDIRGISYVFNLVNFGHLKGYFALWSPLQNGPLCSTCQPRSQGRPWKRGCWDEQNNDQFADTN